jgi:anti-sigma regulatory factor (Ser/Thr protein kinase)
MNSADAHHEGLGAMRPFGTPEETERSSDLGLAQICMQGRQPSMEEEMSATSGAPEQDACPSAGSPALLPGTRWRRLFPGEARQFSLLRRWLESILPDCPSRDDVACVATELGTNAVRHTASGQGGRFVLEITWQESAVRVAVADGGAAGTPRVIDDPAGEQGRGLLLVESLSIRFGVCGDHRGRLVWADVPWAVADDADPAASRDRTAGEPFVLATAGLVTGHDTDDPDVMAAVASLREQLAGHPAACHHTGLLS